MDLMQLTDLTLTLIPKLNHRARPEDPVRPLYCPCVGLHSFQSSDRFYSPEPVLSLDVGQRVLSVASLVLLKTKQSNHQLVKRLLGE